MKASLFTKGSSSRFGLVALWLVLSLVPAWADWPNDHPTKYYQPPELKPSGYNILAATPPAGAGLNQPLVIADDFPCTQTGPITDIHIWASWLGDSAALNITPVPITLAIWSDVPTAPGLPPSHPGVKLWSQTFLPGGAIPGHYKVVPKGFAPSPFWDPDPPPAGNILGNDSILWQYNFYTDAANVFVQQGTAAAPTNYWLSVTAGTNLVKFGWRTSPAHYNDNAVFGHLDPSGTIALGDWMPMFAPVVPTSSIDMAFALTTTPQTPPPPTPTSKWLQSPDLQSGLGLDVNATVPNTANGWLTLADDFQCTIVGAITNIQFWASFKNDLQPGAGGNSFVVSIWSDAPKTSAGFSHPFQRLWSQRYDPGDYKFIPAGAGNEHFYDPETGQLGGETNVWLYSFDILPTNSFCQQGKGTIYWVSISAISPPAAFLQWGWKTSTNHWGDIGVHARVDALSGVTLTPWQPIFNPVAPVPLPVDFAFQINSGPPTPDCDPALGAASIQPPDTSTNGLDVRALQPASVGDDFPCRIRGPISGFTIWGSWLGDQVDTNANFQVNLWTDVPASAATGLASHPGQLICSSIFSPPQTLGNVLRYQYSLYRANVQEMFWNPILPGNSGLVGSDTQIWRYDFFPFVPSCFVQDGSPFSNNKIFWVTVSYLPTAGTGNNNVFGWKTSTRHFQDAAVYSTNSANWKPLADPRNGTVIDLSKIVWKFPVTGINKDIYNLTTNIADGIQIVLSGAHLITWHYDDTPPWAFTSYIDGTNTVLQWSGRTIPVGGLTHVGYETPGSILPSMIAMNWLKGTNILGPVVQGNWHVLGDPFLIFNNDFYPGPISFGDGSIEYYDVPPGLDQMIPGGQRNPLAIQTLQTPAGGGPSQGGAAVMLNPQPFPPKAMYALIIIVLNGGGSVGAQDFVLVPLDQALVPAVQSLSFTGNGSVLLHFDSEIGRMYQLQSSGSLTNPGWLNVGEAMMATGNDTIVTAPMSGDQNFYRIMLMP